MTDNEYLDDAKKEYSRADHLVYVSLKYTRTCDVIKHALERMINTIDFLFSALLEEYEKKEKIETIPIAPLLRAKLLKELLPEDEVIADMVALFLKFRKISKAEFTRSCEFRRHVTLTATLANDELVELNIDNVTEYLKNVKDLHEHVLKLIEEDLL